jgi:hypothetical protein
MSKNDAVQKLEALRQEHEKVRDALMTALPKLFNTPVDDIPELHITGLVYTGILISGGTRYRFRVDGKAGVKELAPE